MIVVAFTFFFPHSGSGLGASASSHKDLRFLHIGICKRPCASATINICVWARETATLMTFGFAGKPVQFPVLTMFNITTGNSLPCAWTMDSGGGASLKHGSHAVANSLAWASYKDSAWTLWRGWDFLRILYKARLTSMCELFTLEFPTW